MNHIRQSTRASEPVEVAPPGGRLEDRITQVGESLAASLNRVLDAVPDRPSGPMALSRAIGVDKVLASRVLKAVRFRDPIALTHHIPGPDPLRRLLRAAGQAGVDSASIGEAEDAVDAFEQLIRHEAGDRSGLDAIISAWLPEVRRQFEFSRKQSAFRAMSQLRGAAADLNLGAALLHPSDDGRALDVIWLFGLLGLQRLRPGVGVKFASRRVSPDSAAPRQPRTLAGEPVEGLDGLRLDQFSTQPPPDLEIHRAGDAVHYCLAGNAFGPGSAVDLVFAEANFREMDRYIAADKQRKAHVFAEIGTPSKALLFDVFLHEDVFADSSPELHLYDTVLDGVANVNDPGRRIDRLDFLESVHPLGRGIEHCRLNEAPQYPQMLRHVFEQLGWRSEQFRGHRCRIEYPIYGSQVVMAFDAPPPPEVPQPQ